MSDFLCMDDGLWKKTITINDEATTHQWLGISVTTVTVAVALFTVDAVTDLGRHVAAWSEVWNTMAPWLCQP